MGKGDGEGEGEGKATGSDMGKGDVEGEGEEKANGSGMGKGDGEDARAGAGAGAGASALSGAIAAGNAPGARRKKPTWGWHLFSSQMSLVFLRPDTPAAYCTNKTEWPALALGLCITAWRHYVSGGVGRVEGII